MRFSLENYTYTFHASKFAFTSKLSYKVSIALYLGIPGQRHRHDQLGSTYPHTHILTSS
jgi:hypothetical protein